MDTERAITEVLIVSMQRPARIHVILLTPLPLVQTNNFHLAVHVAINLPHTVSAHAFEVWKRI